MSMFITYSYMKIVFKFIYSNLFNKEMSDSTQADNYLWF